MGLAMKVRTYETKEFCSCEHFPLNTDGMGNNVNGMAGLSREG